jgi:uncharacterized protein YecE (DUF72 family)
MPFPRQLNTWRNLGRRKPDREVSVRAEGVEPPRPCGQRIFLPLRLSPPSPKCPLGRFRHEIRNCNWLLPQFVEALRSRGVALALIDQGWMPRPAQWFDRFDPITANFTYVRWLGDRRTIEKQTKTWDRVIVDRHAELAEWVDLLVKVAKRQVLIYGYANNHYAGHGPATVELFREMWSAVTGPVVASKKLGGNRTLFD